MATIKRKDINLNKLKQIRVCSDHFVNGSPAKLYLVPSLKLRYYSSVLRKLLKDMYEWRNEKVERDQHR